MRFLLSFFVASANKNSAGNLFDWRKAMYYDTKESGKRMKEARIKKRIYAGRVSGSCWNGRKQHCKN